MTKRLEKIPTPIVHSKVQGAIGFPAGNNFTNPERIAFNIDHAPRTREPLPLIMGVDPGLGGAIAFYNHKTKLIDSIFDMPLLKPPKIDLKRNAKPPKAKIDIFTLSNIIGAKALLTEFCIIEEVGTRPDQGIVSAFTFGYVTGLVTGVVGANTIPTYLVKPAIWKALTHLSYDKRLSIMKAQELFPGIELGKTQKHKADRAEAAILAWFGTRYLK